MKRILAAILTAAILITVLASCTGTPSDSSPPTSSGQPSSSAQPSGSAPAQESKQPEIPNFNYEGLPIVNEKISLNCLVVSNAAYQDFNTLWVTEYVLEPETNIHIDWTTVFEEVNTKILLMFSSQDYPDILMNAPYNDQIFECAQAGLIYSIDDLLQYAPKWKAYFEAYPYNYKYSKMADGVLWGLPQVREDAITSSALRYINAYWLEELGLKMPATTDDFYQYLRAVKENAGNGTIPADVMPYAYTHDAFRAGQWDVYHWFGVPAPFDGYYFRVDDNGRVIHEAQNPKLKDAINYLHKLYSEGLIPPEGFTDGGAVFTAMLAFPPQAGYYAQNQNYARVAADGDPNMYVPMPTLTSPGNSAKMSTRYAGTCRPNILVMFKVNKYPEATMRYFDLFAEPDYVAAVGGYGPGNFPGYTIIRDGDKYIENPNPKVLEEGYLYSMFAFAPVLANRAFFDMNTVADSNAYRTADIMSTWNNDITPIEWLLPGSNQYTPDERTRRSEIELDINGYVAESVARWITSGGVDAEWDAYLSRLQSLRVEELITLYQNMVDRFNS